MKAGILAIMTMTLVAGAAGAQEDNGERPEREHGRPPQVALEACAAAVQGDACSFEGRRGEQLSGSCEAPSDKPLACRPDNASPPAHSELQ